MCGALNQHGGEGYNPEKTLDGQGSVERSGSRPKLFMASGCDAPLDPAPSRTGQQSTDHEHQYDRTQCHVNACRGFFEPGSRKNQSYTSEDSPQTGTDPQTLRCTHSNDEAAQFGFFT